MAFETFEELREARLRLKRAHEENNLMDSMKYCINLSGYGSFHIRIASECGGYVCNGGEIHFD